MTGRFVAALRGLRRTLLRPFYRLLLRFVAVEGPWQVFENVDVQFHALGAGSLHDFRWYFQGESAVPVTSVDDVCDWLMKCSKVSDWDQFGVTDKWQHPVEFEKTRKGDCDDHAVWAWRKLSELGLQAELFTGTLLTSDGRAWVPHAWVMFICDGVACLLESTAMTRREMTVTAADARNRYRPFYSVDSAFGYKAYGALIAHLRGDDRRLRQ